MRADLAAATESPLHKRGPAAPDDRGGAGLGEGRDRPSRREVALQFLADEHERGPYPSEHPDNYIEIYEKFHVTADLTRESNCVGALQQGQVAGVLEIRESESYMRGRIAAPAGWISLSHCSGTEHAVKKAVHRDHIQSGVI